MRERCFNFCKTAAKPFFGSMLFLFVGVWAWNSGVYYRSLPSPGLVLQVPVSTFELLGAREGLHLVARENDNKRGFDFHAVACGPQGYHKFGLNALGFTIVANPHTIRGQCGITPRFLALVFPYWFFIAFAAIALLWSYGLLAPMVARLRSSGISKAAIAVVLFFFFIMNASPSVRGGSDRDGIHAWLSRVFFPSNLNRELLRYGFPFECFRTVFVDGKRVDAFLGDDTLGWKQEKVMENLIVALLAALAIGMAIDRIKNGKRSTIPQAVGEPVVSSTSILAGQPPASPAVSIRESV